MAKHNILATSTLCGASGHQWVPGLAANYRQCGQCRTVEVFKNGEWVSPTGRRKRETSAPAPRSPWSQEIKDRGLQSSHVALANVPPPVSPVVPVSPERANADKRNVLFQWGEQHGYPQLGFELAGGRIYTIVSGKAAWHATCYQASMPVVEAGLESAPKYRGGLPELRPAERAYRLKLLELARKRDWVRFTCKAPVPDNPEYHFTLIIDGGEESWQSFAHHGKYEQVCSVCELLEQTPVQVKRPSEGIQAQAEIGLRNAIAEHLAEESQKG